MTFLLLLLFLRLVLSCFVTIFVLRFPPCCFCCFVTCGLYVLCVVWVRVCSECRIRNSCFGVWFFFFFWCFFGNLVMSFSCYFVAVFLPLLLLPVLGSICRSRSVCLVYGPLMFIHWLYVCLSRDTCLFCCCFWSFDNLVFCCYFSMVVRLICSACCAPPANIYVCLRLCLFVISVGGSPRNWLVLVCLCTSLRLLCLSTVTTVIFACPVWLCIRVLTHLLPFSPPLRVPCPNALIRTHASASVTICTHYCPSLSPRLIMYAFWGNLPEHRPPFMPLHDHLCLHLSRFCVRSYLCTPSDSSAPIPTH